MRSFILFLLVLVIQASPLLSQNVAIPDTAFLYALIDEGVDTDEDSLISFTEAEAVITLEVDFRDISDMTGIEAFVNLDTLKCFGNEISSLDLTNLSGLIMLQCGGNNLTKLDLSNLSELSRLYFPYNQIDSLDLSNLSKLEELWCTDNPIAKLDLSNNPLLSWVEVPMCQLDSLDLSHNNELDTLICNQNNLTSLDLSHNQELKLLICWSNNLTSLDLSNNLKLTWVVCADNQISGNLDVSKHKLLRWLGCAINQLTSINLDSCISLRGIVCPTNQLSALDVSGCDSLKEIQCWDNSITSLDLSNNSQLGLLSCENNQLSELDVSNNPALYFLWCNGNQLTTLDISNNKQIGTQPYANWVSLNLGGMTTLGEVCVWDSFLDDIGNDYDIDGSPYMCFETDCNGECGTSVEEYDPKGFSIYPNPTHSLLTIETQNSSEYCIEITSLNGQQCFSTEFEGISHQIDLSYFKKGIYFLNIRSKDLEITRKIIKL